MNVNLEQLKNRATVYYSNGYCDCPEVDIGKFAELIVQNCADLFEIEYGQASVSGNEVAQILVRHFGINYERTNSKNC